MTSEINKLIAMYIVGVGETGIPSSHLWMAVDPNMRDVNTHNRILAALTDSGMLVVRNHFVTLTEKGLALHKKLEAIYLPLAGKTSAAPSTPTTPSAQ